MSDILSRMTAKRLAGQAAGTPPPFTPKPPPVPPPLPDQVLLGNASYVGPKPPPLHGDAGITAYHGSPHDFDKFTFDQFGKGEGKAAFGHGLYFADDPGIARWYKNTLDRRRLREAYRDEGFGRGGYLNEEPDVDEFEALLETMTPKHQRLLRALRKAYDFGFDSPMQALTALAEDAKKIDTGGHPSFDYTDAEGLEAMRAYRDLGYGYQVNIDAPPRSMLHFNNPLYKQSESVLRGLSETGATDLLNKRDRITLGPSMFGTNLPGDPIVDEVMTLPGERAYNALAHKYGDIQASKMLQKAGIPGHRYADAHSRVPLGQGKGKAQRTSNTVMYPGSEHLIDITKKYGLLAPLVAEQLMQEE